MNNVTLTNSNISCIEIGLKFKAYGVDDVD